MAGLGGMDEERRRAGAGEGRGNLSRDVSRLADAADDDAPATVEDEFDGPQEACIKAIREACDRIGLNGEHAARKFQRR